MTGCYCNRASHQSRSPRWHNDPMTFQHPMHRVRSFSIVGPYQLEITFEDGLVRRIDFLPVLEGALFGPLKDLALFEGVKLDSEGYTLVWPNGADFDPANLHDWPEVESEFVARAREWANQQR